MLAITLDNLSKYFPAPAGKTATAAVDSVSLAIPAGSLFFLLGPSGCGKTTLLRMIAGFTTPTSGRILFGTRDISAVPAHQRDTGMVFQSYALWPHMTVAENVAFGLNVRKIKNPDRDRRIDEALELVQMTPYKDRRPNQLSGGQQQRVALARALAIRPQCLLLDEPLSNLDAKLRLEMRSEIRRIVKAAGTTAVYVTHDQKEALSMADHIALMRQGRLEQLGTPNQLYRHPATPFVADFIGESNFIPGIIEKVDGNSVLVQTPAGPLLAFLPPTPPNPTPNPNPNLNPNPGPVAPPLRPLVPGSSVTLAIRPEGISFTPSASPPTPPPTSPPALSPASPSALPFDPLRTNLFPAQILSSTYLGATTEYLLSLPGLTIPLKLITQFPPPDSPMTIQIPPDQIMLINAPSA